MGPSPDSVIPHNGSQNSRGCLTYYYQFIIKSSSSKTAKQKRWVRRVWYGGGVQGLWPTPGLSPSQDLRVLTNSEAL